MTGIVRRIDDLGRIVIPKEIRRKLQIDEGDPLEIIPTKDGVFIKPYGQSHALRKMAEEICKVLEELLAATVMITDNESFLSQGHVKGMISPSIRQFIQNGEIIDSEHGFDVSAETNIPFGYAVLFPITHNSQSQGSIIVLREENKLNGEERRLVEAFSILIGQLCTEKEG